MTNDELTQQHIELVEQYQEMRLALMAAFTDYLYDVNSKPKLVQAMRDYETNIAAQEKIANKRGFYGKGTGE